MTITYIIIVFCFSKKLIVLALRKTPIQAKNTTFVTGHIYNVFCFYEHHC